MEDKSTEKIIEKIKKVLELSKNNPSQEESKAAALKAQKLMAEYHISMVEVEAVEDIENIVEKKVNVGMGNKWKYFLSGIIAKNFRCKYFYYGKDTVVFYGYEMDANIAAMTFEFLFKTGNKAANNYYQRLKSEAQKNNEYFFGKGIKNSFLSGYIQGIKEVLEKQCTALMIVIPEKVEKEYENISGNFETMHNKIKTRGNYQGEQARVEGRKAGKNTIQSKGIEAVI